MEVGLRHTTVTACAKAMDPYHLGYGSLNWWSAFHQLSEAVSLALLSTFPEHWVVKIQPESASTFAVGALLFQ